MRPRILLIVVTLTFSLFGGASAEIRPEPRPNIKPPPRPSLAALEGGEVMNAVRRGRWLQARRAARRHAPALLPVVDWHALRGGVGTFEDYLDFVQTHGDWPGMDRLVMRGESSITAATPRGDVSAFFGNRTPQTAHGALHLADALRIEERPEEAVQTLVEAWRTLAFSPSETALYLEEFEPLLRPHVTERLDMLLWRGRFDDAERLFPHVSEGWRALARARIGLRRDTPGVDGLIAKVPSALSDDAGLAYERFLWRLDRGRYAAAMDLIKARSGSAEELGQPERWAGWRRYLVRSELEDGRASSAYDLASGHHLERGGNFADLEWLAGFIALQRLDRPEDALQHFRKLREGVASPISLGRAGYWEGLALEALNRDAEAAEAYARGAEHQTSYYGLLAAERAGLPMDPALPGAAPATGWEDADFADSTVLAAALALQAAGELNLAERFFTHLAESLDPLEVAQLGELTLTLGEPHIAVMVAKRAARRGIAPSRPYFPVSVPLDSLPVEQALALSIIRRESEFDPRVVSPAGALGLMQLMPRTAEAVAGRLGVSYSKARLTSDPAYNARLGSKYLAELAERYDGNIVLIAAAYNAGPSRADRWIAENGDPRSSGVDVIDWVEAIPFRETRNYVMRVAESLVVYRARVAGEVQPLTLSEELKARR